MELSHDPQHLAIANEAIARFHPKSILDWSALQFGSKLVMSTSFGRNSGILYKLVAERCPHIVVIFVEVGKPKVSDIQHAEKLSERFGLEVDWIRSSAPLSRAEEKALESGGEAGRKVNEKYKLEPMRRALARHNARAILHGVRAAQSTDRLALQHLMPRKDGILRIYPILRMTNREADDFALMHDVEHPDGPPSGKKKRPECGLHL